MVTGGRNQGRVGTLVAKEKHIGGFDIAHVRDALGRDFSTRMTNIFAISPADSKPWISIPKGGGIKLSIAEERDQRRRQREAREA